MGKIFCLMGKSASGKDTIYRRILEQEKLNLRRIIPYTTRPIRCDEVEGDNYFFCTEEMVQELEKKNKIIELRSYDTMYGVWKYFTVDDGQIDLKSGNYLLIGTLDTFVKIREYFGDENVVPIYIEVEDGDRLIRAIEREKQQEKPKYEEMCRRFISDAADFSQENLELAGIKNIFNNLNLDDVLREIVQYMNKVIKYGS